MISNQVADWIYNTHRHKVTQWNHGILNPPLIATYADAVHSNGAALDNCFGVIDGTVQCIVGQSQTSELFIMATSAYMHSTFNLPLFEHNS